LCRVVSPLRRVDVCCQGYVVISQADRAFRSVRSQPQRHSHFASLPAQGECTHV